jgi:hypothetical protein
MHLKAHAKGGVEGDMGYFRRNDLVPTREAQALASFAQQVCLKRFAQGLDGQTRV